MKLTTKFIQTTIWVIMLFSISGELAFSQNARIANKQEIEKFLKLHNQYRHEVGVDSLTWSNELAEYALEWVKALAAEYRM